MLAIKIRAVLGSVPPCSHFDSSLPKPLFLAVNIILQDGDYVMMQETFSLQPVLQLISGDNTRQLLAGSSELLHRGSRVSSKHSP